MSSSRNTAIDGIKTVAIFGTLFIHTSASGLLDSPVGGLNWSVDLFWASLLRCAVPLFLMCSGALFLPEEKTLPIRALWGKYILRIAVALAFWSGLYALWDHGFPLSPAGGFAAGLKWAFLDWVCLRHKYHLYYLVILIAVYAVLPLTRFLAHRATPALLRYVMLLWVVCGSLLPLLFALPPLRYLEGFVRQYALNLSAMSIGYGLAGYLMSRSAPRRAPAFYVLLYLLGFAITYCGVLFTSLRAGALSELFLYGSAPGVLLQSVGLFGLIQTLCKRALRLPRWTETVSRASFCIYLIHPLFLDLMHFRNFNAATHFSLWAVPLQVILLFLTGLICWLILRRIPVVNKYLI